MAEVPEFDVAIIGYGPVGAVLAGLLGMNGISTVILDRNQYVYELARVGALNDETFRTYQRLGLDGEILARGLEGTWFSWLNAEGDLLMKWQMSDGGRWPNGFAKMTLWHQPEIDALVRERVEGLPSVEARLEHEVKGLEQDDHGVVLDVLDIKESQRYRLRAKYAVGCDGGRSSMRTAIGGEFEQLGPSNPWVVIDTVLRHAVADRLPDHQVHYCDPARPATYIRGVGDRRRWEFKLMPGEIAEEMERPERIHELLEPWVKPDDLEIDRAVVYTFHSLNASRWRRGRVFIAGDAAHMMPPFLGEGLASGVRDARNLAWKLQAALAGASDSLLDTYESERSPHCRQFIELATQVGDVIEVTDPEAAAERDRRMLAGTLSEFEIPTPSLGPGLHGGVPQPPVGTLFPQPQLRDGRRLDDATGERFAIVAASAAFEAVSPELERQWRQAGVAIIADDGEEITRALEYIGAGAALVRPDRYVLAAASSPAELEEATQQIPNLPKAVKNDE